MIHLLDEETINAIAAGEVVENSASVVKELIENALDAGARQVTLEIVAGGKQLIRISDDGSGMGPDDARLALQRHATSKIRSKADLETILTMGFRGEALAAIGAISRLRLLTNASESENEAFLLVQEGGRLLESQRSLRKKGTTIEIQNLFYNTPARFKFQRSIASDTAQILKVLQQMALAHPAVQFTLVQGEEKLFFSKGSELKNRLLDLFEQEEWEEVSGEEGPYALQGFISQPLFSRGNRTGQFLFINGRAVVSPLIAHAVLEGYGTLLAPRRYPLFALHLTMDPRLVDVNVHPQKWEVRLREELFLKQWIAKIVSKAFHKQAELPSFLPWDGPSRAFTAPLAIQPPQMAVQLSFAHIPATAWREFLLIDQLEIPEKHRPKEEGLFVLHAERALQTLLTANQKTEAPPVPHYLLEPVVVDLMAHERLLVEEAGLEAWGFVMRSFGPKSLLIEALPARLNPNEVKDLINQIIHDKAQSYRAVKAAASCLKRAPSDWLPAFFALDQIEKSPMGEPNFFIIPLAFFHKSMQKGY